MARQPMVTRTIKTTKVTALCTSVTKRESYNKEFSLSRVYKSDKILLKKLQNLYQTDDEKIVHIVSSDVVNIRYGMSEDAFIKSANELPLLTTK